MSKIIVDNRSRLDDWAAMQYALVVVKDGRVSLGNSYSLASTWREFGVAVYARRNRASDTLIVADLENDEQGVA